MTLRSFLTMMGVGSLTVVALYYLGVVHPNKEKVKWLNTRETTQTTQNNSNTSNR
ncbi:hypothetical protein [Candidatus Phytoplasma pruni]|uniref:Uncharacterized protein n=1 Tax=Candidatus Phytoplasma pruni TaxID=479893 RepID=A0A851H9L9_9MOLU|nr:hypothetical protein [Candidatus Phytoplasma pruni]NWN45567.1 hypothetical protein [Candidatus Phytoplasma pruni]